MYFPLPTLSFHYCYYHDWSVVSHLVEVFTHLVVVHAHLVRELPRESHTLVVGLTLLSVAVQ